MLKRFDFFIRTLIEADGKAVDPRAVTATTPSHEAFKSEEFTCFAAGGGRFVLGDAKGGVTILRADGLKTWRLVLSTEPDPAISQISIVEDYLFLVTASIAVKVYKLTSDELTMPRIMVEWSPSSATIKDIKRVGDCTCMAVSKDLHMIVLGFKDGSVLQLSSRAPLVDTGLVDDARWMTFSRGSQSAGMCTVLGFPRSVRGGFWVAFERRLIFIDSYGTETELDPSEGAMRDCAIVDGDNFIVARKDRVAFYTPDTPGSCYSILGNHEKIALCQKNIILVSTGNTWKGLGTNEIVDANPNSSSSTPTTLSSSASKPHTIQILDLYNKLIAHEFALSRETGDPNVAFVAGDDKSRCVFVLTASKRRLWRLQEKTTEEKLEDLLKRNLFSTAATLARSTGCDPSFVADIYRRYGDHLYEKGSYDDSIAQYALTVSHLEPSYVIRRFLEAPRVRSLTAYLETLHGLGPLYREDLLVRQPQPTQEHTTLLLTCYARLKADDKIRELFGRAASINLESALLVLKDTGRFDLALELAKRHDQDEWFCRMLMELADADNTQRALTALDFIRTKQRTSLFREHCGKLMELCPKETIAAARYLIIEARATTLDALIESFINHQDALADLCSDVVLNERLPAPSRLVANTALELALSRGNMDHAMDILSSPRVHFDDAFALSCVRKYKFREGERYLHERALRWNELLQCKMEDYVDGTPLSGVLALAKAKLPKDADAWLGILRWLSNRSPSAERDSSIREALAHVEQNDVVPPLLSLRVLSQNPSVTLGVVRPYLVSQIQRATRQTENDREEVRKLREETERMRAETIALMTQPKVFNATTCCMTGAPLELPVVHFMSGNSYNLSSLPLSNTANARDRLEDPKYASEQRGVLDYSTGLAKRRQDVDEEFFTGLDLDRGGEAGFAHVASFFDKCLFEDEQD